MNMACISHRYKLSQMEKAEKSKEQTETQKSENTETKHS